MKSTELRIGNWYSHYGIPKQATHETISNLYQIEQNGKIAIDCSDLPLTEEWLLKFGFHKKKWSIENGLVTCFYYELNDIVVYIIESGFEIEIKIGDNQFNLFKQWKYVHQIQNLYFALKGEEL